MKPNRTSKLTSLLAGIDQKMIDHPTDEQLAMAYETLDEFSENAGMTTQAFSAFACRYFAARGVTLTVSKKKATMTKQAFTDLTAKITATLEKLESSSLPTVPAAKMPDTTPNIGRPITRADYPQILIDGVEPIPESQMPALLTLAHRQQADDRAYRAIPRLLEKYAPKVLTAVDENGLLDEQRKLVSLLGDSLWIVQS